MVTQDVEDSLENDLTWRMYTDILVVSSSAQVLLYFGFKADLIYPCCNMLSVHFYTVLPAIDARVFFVLLAFVAFLNRFAQVAFMIKRLEANTSGMWLPSFIQLTAYHLFTICMGYCLYNYRSDKFTDDLDYCAYMNVDLCNKYSMEGDHNHFHVDFRLVSLLLFLNGIHIFATILVMAGCLLRMFLSKYDINILIWNYPKDRAFEEREETLLTNSLHAIVACILESVMSGEVLSGKSSEILHSHFQSPVTEKYRTA